MNEMKKIVFLLAFTLLLFCGCKQDVDFGTDSVCNEEIFSNFEDSLVVASSPYSAFYNEMRKSLKTRSSYSSTGEVGIKDILGFPVNIQVVQNIYNKKFLQYNGLHKAITLSNFSSNTEDNLFVLHEDPLTDEVYITPYKLSDNKYYLGAATQKGSSVWSLYALSGEPTNGGYWEISKGQTEYSFVLKNTQVLEQGPGGWSDIYSLALAVEDNQLKFQKYASKGNQEFIITPNDEFEVKSLKVDNAASRFLDSPDFVIEEIYTNNSSLAQELTTNVSKKATNVSNFSRSTSVNTKVSHDVKVGVGIVSGSAHVEIGKNSTWNYGESESIEDSRNYDFPIKVAPKTRIRVTISVGQKTCELKYTAVLKGKNTGVTLTEQGIWNNVSCTNILVDVQEEDLSGNVLKSKKFEGIPSTRVTFD